MQDERETAITSDMDDVRGAGVLRNKKTVFRYMQVKPNKLTPAEVTRLEDATRRDARGYAKTLFDKFGVGKRYENRNADIEFTFSGMGFDKSIYEQNAARCRLCGIWQNAVMF